MATEQNRWNQIDLESLEPARLGDLFPNLRSLPGLGPALEDLPTLVRHRLRENVELRWDAIANLTVGEVLSWRGTGEGKVRVLLEYLQVETDRLNSKMHGGADRGSEIRLLEAIKEISAWGHHNGAESVFEAVVRAAESDAPDLPLESLAILRSLPAKDLGADRLPRYDADVAFEWLIGQFDDRRLELLHERALVKDAPPTLEELGTRYGVTRERVRQLEVQTVERLESLMTHPQALPLRRTATQAADELGAAVPVAEVGADRVKDLALRSKLLLWLAGPYRFDGKWLVRRPWESVGQLVEYCFASVAVQDAAESSDVTRTLLENGVRAELVRDTIEATGAYKEFGSKLARWGRTYSDRAATVLEIAATPLSSKEILDRLGSGSLLSLRNVLNSDASFIRVGKDKFGLEEWGGQEYAGVVPAMVERLEATGSMSIEALGVELAESFGVSPASVSINATMHPLFFAENGRVRLRGSNDPYEPDRDLKTTPGCWFVDGAWALAIEIDRDLLRGSGRSIPEAFAVHLGLTPFESKSLRSDYSEVRFSWGQTPAVGSLRAVAEALGGDVGDKIFIRHPNPFWIDFRVVRRGEIELPPEERLEFLVGSECSGSISESIERALDLSPVRNLESSRLISILERKGAFDVIEVLNRM